MESSEILKKAISAHGTKAVAADMSVSPSLVYKWCEPRSSSPGEEQSGTRNPLDRVVEIMEITSDTSIISWLCQQSGGFFVQNPTTIKKADREEEVVKRTQKMLSEFSDVLDRVVNAMADDDCIDKGEAKAIRAEWEELKSCGEGFVVGCERGVYRK